MKILEGFPRRYKITKVFLHIHQKSFSVGKTGDCSEDDAQCGKRPGRQVQGRYEEGATWDLPFTKRWFFNFSGPHAKIEDFNVDWDLSMSKTNSQGCSPKVFVSYFFYFLTFHKKMMQTFSCTGLSRYWEGFQAVGSGHRGKSQLSRQNWCPLHFEMTVISINIPVQKQNKTKNGHQGKGQLPWKNWCPNIFTFQITVINIHFQKNKTFEISNACYEHENCGS